MKRDQSAKALEFPRFGGQGLITQPRWLVSL